MSVSVLANLLLKAQQDRDYSAMRFRPLEESTLKYLHTNDRLIANTYKSFGNHKLWVLMSVLWLLGAYTEYVKLLSMRLKTHAAADARHVYYTEAGQLHLAGGGFAEFRTLSEKIYTMIEQINPHDEAAVDAADAQIRALYGELDWMPLPFHAILDGKTHLPRAKIRPDLFLRRQGFMRSGAYRQHFFGNHTMIDVIRLFAMEKWKYSKLGIARQRRLEKRSARLSTGGSTAVRPIGKELSHSGSW